MDHCPVPLRCGAPSAGSPLPLNVVRAAAPSAAGLVLDTAASGGPDLEVLIASFARLSPAGRRHVALVRCMLAAAETAS